MKEIKEIKQEFKVILNRAEIEYIQKMTQNFIGDDEEPLDESKIRQSLFVDTSRLLGFDMNQDGTINRNTNF